MKSKRKNAVFVAAVLVAAVGLAFAGCFGGADDGAEQEGVTPSVVAQVISLPAMPAGEGPDGSAEEYSTFSPKDPFIPQAVASTETSVPGEPTTATTAGPQPPSSTETTYKITTTTRWTGGGGGGTGTTTTTKPAPTTTTTAPHVHVLKILGAGDVGGAPATTFQVDSSVYKDKRIGDVVSSSWGQIKVLDISAASKVVTLLHGSETLVLAVGQSVFE